MNEVVIVYIDELLNTIQEGLGELEINKNQQLVDDIQDAKKCIECVIEEDLTASICERVNSNAFTDEEWIHTIIMILDEFENPIRINNRYDKEFFDLIQYIWNSSEEQLLANMKKSLETLKNNSKANYEGFVKYFERFPLWGKLYPDRLQFTG